ncbi:unnamed protein product, partial [Cylicostephanus goldi]
RVNKYLEAVDKAPTDPNAAGSRLFLIAYTAAKMYLPPYQFPTLCKVISEMGVDIGKRHHTREGFVRMTSFIANNMRQTLINYIRVNQSPFSLLADTTTDPDSKQVLLLFVRFPDRISLHPTTHFLEAIELKESETAQYLFDVIYSYFERSGLLNEYTWNLVAVATDGASVMSGSVGGLRGLLNRNVSQSRKDSMMSRGATRAELDAVPEEPVIWIHCMAHKIELALKDAFTGGGDQNLAQWRKFATMFLNKLRVFFTAPSRRRVLLAAHSTMSTEHFINLKRVITVRWASSEEVAIRSFLRMYKYVWVALQEIFLSGNFARKDRLKAAAFLHVIKSLKFYRYMVFQLIVLEGIARLSKDAQNEAYTIWRARRDVDELLNNLVTVAHSPHTNENTLPFIEAVSWRYASSIGEWRSASLASGRRWFWDGWQYSGEATERIRYRLGDEALALEFNMEAEVQRGREQQRERDLEEQRIAEITRMLRDERASLIQYLSNPTEAEDFDEDDSRRSIGDLQVAEEFKAAQFTNMDLEKRNKLVDDVAEALRSRL